MRKTNAWTQNFITFSLLLLGTVHCGQDSSETQPPVVAPQPQQAPSPTPTVGTPTSPAPNPSPRPSASPTLGADSYELWIRGGQYQTLSRRFYVDVVYEGRDRTRAARPEVFLGCHLRYRIPNTRSQDLYIAPNWVNRVRHTEARPLAIYFTRTSPELRFEFDLSNANAAVRDIPHSRIARIRCFIADRLASQQGRVTEIVYQP